MRQNQAATGRLAMFGWAMYDFANHSFTTLVVTFVYATYFTKAIAANEIQGTTLWSRAVTLSSILVAVLSPPLGALADAGRYRKRFLAAATSLAVLGSAMLYTVLPGQVMTALCWFVLANTAYEIGVVFYNAFLPDLAPPGKIGRLSGYGWALGYLGGLGAMFVAMITLVNPQTPWFGFTRDLGQNIRATNLLVAVWFTVFSMPLFFLLKEKGTGSLARRGLQITAAYRQLRASFAEIQKYRQILRFLAARLLYNDGLITVFAFGGIYAAGTFHFTFQEIMVFGVVLSATAGLGAAVFGFLDDYLGGKTTIMLSLIGLAAAGILAIIAQGRIMFWTAAILVGILAGPNQSASRSLMGRLVPADKEGQFFGFFAFSGKFTAFLGPLLLGIITNATGSQRAGMAVVVVLFAAGLLLLAGVRESGDRTQKTEDRSGQMP